MRRGTGRGALLAGLALAGCVAAGCGAGAPQPGAAPTPMPQTPAGSAPATDPSGDGVLIRFDRQGGLAGLTDRLVIREDGGFTLQRRRPPLSRSGRLTEAERAELVRMLAGSGFGTLPATQSARGSDLFTYHLTYADRQILAQDGGIAAPLRPVIAALTTIVQKYGS
ncbi:hypothetical protein GCM10023322_62370 [Rugosimonospora acidiphila]|uniref:Secreted protein n=1 Tax=Rugosimonospora acidiphila TaxID=556531 RepID=A0ABP9SFP7_9ACTN